MKDNSGCMYYVCAMVRPEGSLGAFFSRQFEVKAKSPKGARHAAIDKARELGYETRNIGTVSRSPLVN